MLVHPLALGLCTFIPVINIQSVRYVPSLPAHPHLASLSLSFQSYRCVPCIDRLPLSWQFYRCVSCLDFGRIYTLPGDAPHTSPCWELPGCPWSSCEYLPGLIFGDGWAAGSTKGPYLLGRRQLTSGGELSFGKLWSAAGSGWLPL